MKYRKRGIQTYRERSSACTMQFGGQMNMGNLGQEEQTEW